MIKKTWRPFPFGLLALVVAVVISMGTSAQADVTTDQSGSILIFPKVINDGTRDTLIQISNTGNTLVHTKCYYINGATLFPDRPYDPRFNPRLWQVTDFFLWLTRQQPTHWDAGRGRPINPFDNLQSNLSGAGIDPGQIPPVTPGFTGALVCIEIGLDGNPLTGNKLKGEATLKDIRTGDISKYNAVAIIGGPSAGITGRSLQLDNDQYNSCPNVLLFDHFAEGAPSPVIGAPNNLGLCVDGDCPINTELTLMPCSIDFENGYNPNSGPGRVTVFFDVTNEFEQKFSTTTRVDCWFNEDLDSINSTTWDFATSINTLSVYTRIVPTGGGGLIGLAEETHANSDGTEAKAAYQLQIEDSFYDPPQGRDTFDVITLSGGE